MNFRLHGFEPASRANGPGLRAVVWFQGCTLGCPGCFNPGTHDANAGTAGDTAELAAKILAARQGLEGVSFSGGEPLQQPLALLDLLERLEPSGLGTLVFSGYTLAEIQRQPLGPAVLGRIDVLVAGRYRQAAHLGRGLIGSHNQRIHLLTSRHTMADFAAVPRAEIILHKDGSFTFSGIAPAANGSKPGPGAACPPALLK